MITRPNARREYAAHAPLPTYPHMLRDCPHGQDYCTECVPEGAVIHNNRDIERSSWWLHAPQGVA